MEIRTKLGGLLLTVILQKNNLVFFRSMCKTPNFVVVVGGLGSTRKTLTWWFWKTVALIFFYYFNKKVMLEQFQPTTQFQPLWPLDLPMIYSTPIS